MQNKQNLPFKNKAGYRPEKMGQPVQSKIITFRKALNWCNFLFKRFFNNFSINETPHSL